MTPRRRSGAVVRMLAAWVVGVSSTGVLCQTPPAAAAAPVAAGSILDLQRSRTSTSVELVASGSSPVRATLTQLNPAANAWLLLTLASSDLRHSETYHLENAEPARQRVELDVAHPGALIIEAEGRADACVLWPGAALAQARASQVPYASLCGGRLYLRNEVHGHRTTLEAATEFLRDHVWQGERIIELVRRDVYQDAFIRHGTPASAPVTEPTAASGAPPAARVAADRATPTLAADGLGIDVGATTAFMPGRWVAATGVPGVYVSLVQPKAVIAVEPRGAVLDPVEADALDYLVAFDLSELALGFSLGTEHPRLGWSPRVLDARRGASSPGPDGIDSAAPLVRTGMVSPALRARTVATFAAGFKREHGAFRYGALATVNRGSHYGFVEQGVTFSTLEPGLATVYVLDDGTVGMKTWSRADDVLLGRLRHARQNGVALVERGATAATSVAGPLVNQWAAGNWSGSSDEQLRTLRAGACLLERDGRQFLVYGYFSSATPRAMAHVFLAYGCSYAMHLDMNALEHTYLALYPRSGDQRGLEHLIDGMNVLDQTVGSTQLPRFLGVADDRDFFYLTTRKDLP